MMIGDEFADALFHLKTRVASEVSKLDAAITSFDTMVAYRRQIEILILELVGVLGHISPSAFGHMKQFGFLMQGELFLRLTTAGCTKDALDASKVVGISDDGFLNGGGANLLVALLSVPDSNRRSTRLQIRHGLAKVPVSGDDYSKPVIVISEDDGRFLAQLRIEDFSRPHVEEIESLTRREIPSLHSKLYAFASRDSLPHEDRGWMTGFLIGALSRWMAFQSDLGSDKYIVDFEPVLVHEQGAAVFWFALDQDDLEATLMLSALGRELIQGLYELEFRATVRSQWELSAGAATKETTIHDVQNILDAQLAALERLEARIPKRTRGNFDAYRNDTERHLQLIRKDLQLLKRDGRKEESGIWKANPYQLSELIKSFMTRRDRDGCIWIYQTKGLEYDDGEGFLHSWPVPVCQIGGSPKDLALLLAELVRNAVEANEGTKEWNHETLVSEARSAGRSDYYAVEMTRCPPVALVSITADIRYINIVIKDGGPGLPQSFKELLAERHLLANSPSTKQGGGRGIRQCCLIIRTRYKGRVYYSELDGWNIIIPTIPWPNTKKNV